MIEHVNRQDSEHNSIEKDSDHRITGLAAVCAESMAPFERLQGLRSSQCHSAGCKWFPEPKASHFASMLPGPETIANQLNLEHLSWPLTPLCF